MESDEGIEREAIPFLPPKEKPKPSLLEVKYNISNSTFKTQLPIFNRDSVEEFLRFMYKFNHAKTISSDTLHIKNSKAVQNNYSKVRPKMNGAL